MLRKGWYLGATIVSLAGLCLMICAIMLLNGYQDYEGQMRDSRYERSLLNYRYTSHLKNSALLIDEYGYALRFDSPSAAQAYATQYSEVP